MHTILAWGFPSGGEWIIVAIIGLLLFGKRLPEVGKSLGKGIVEFKKGLKGIETDMDEGVSQPSPQRTIADSSQRTALPSEYKFDPQTGEPINRASAEQPVARDSKPGYKFDPYTGQPISNS
jgi:sec-independent protein translocase protein TatA